MRCVLGSGYCTVLPPGDGDVVVRGGGLSFIHYETKGGINPARCREALPLWIRRGSCQTARPGQTDREGSPPANPVGRDIYQRRCMAGTGQDSRIAAEKFCHLYMQLFNGSPFSPSTSGRRIRRRECHVLCPRRGSVALTEGIKFRSVRLLASPYAGERSMYHASRRAREKQEQLACRHGSDRKMATRSFMTPRGEHYPSASCLVLRRVLTSRRRIGHVSTIY